MKATVDVELTCKAIKSLLSDMGRSDNIGRLNIFATIKTLCDAIETQADSEGTWQGYMAEKSHELLNACGTIAGIHCYENHPAPALASTALESLESSYLSHVKRDDESS